MADEPEIIPQTFLQKLLFYTTAFFVLLGTFSLFAFLFLVPFVIEPAFTTIFMEFDPEPAWCVTIDSEERQGLSNCTWSSCREGCTKEMFQCIQIRVNYKRRSKQEELEELKVEEDIEDIPSLTRLERGIREEYDYPIKDTLNGEELGLGTSEEEEEVEEATGEDDSSKEEMEYFGLMGNDSEWYYTGAKLYPNVKGCGYPPMLNCTIFSKTYKEPGTNFTCYYSQVDPGLVISELDMFQVYMNLVYAMAIPIPSFIISVIYLTFAYFKIYNEDEEEALVKDDDGLHASLPSVPLETSGGITPGSEVFREDLASFGHELKVKMADEMSRESIVDAVHISNSVSGNLSKSMTTSISTPPGPIAAV